MDPKLDPNLWKNLKFFHAPFPTFQNWIPPGIDPQSFYSPNAAGQHGQVQSAVLLFVQLLAPVFSERNSVETTQILPCDLGAELCKG